ncbi:MAG: hypothetical protein J5621_01870 [Paludibacteraceae bacterium]|nr:hypothetical protein [Paludibacteraceae bacterium]
MDIQNFKNGNHRFPVSTDALDFMQNQIFLAAKLASIAGTNVIVKPATSSQDGLVIIGGELLPLQKGTAKSYINIVETPESITAGTITFDNVRIRRVAQYATSGYAVSNFTTLDTIVSIMGRVSAIEGSYMTETAIRALVASSQNTLQNAINTTNNNLNTTNSNLNTAIAQHNLLANRVTNIENTYKTAAQIDVLLAANAQHHMPKGSIIDWYGTCRAANVPYGFVPCGIVCKGLSESAVNAEVTEWRNKYPNNITVSSVYSKGWALKITECNGQVVPDLTNRFIVHAGCDYLLGDTGGKDSVKLTSAQSGQPGSRIHTLSQTTGKAYPGTAANQHDCVNTLTWGTENAQDAVSSHENRPPYYALYKLIKVI